MKNKILNLYKRILLWKLLRKLERANEVQRDGFKLIYTDKFGNNWYTINSAANLHATRVLAAWTAARDVEFSISSDRMKQLLSQINTAINKSDIAEIAKIVGIIEAGLDLYAEPNILLNLACCYTFLNDETNDGFKDYIQDKKRDIWSKDSECKSFFLQFAVSYIGKRSTLQSENVLKYLEEAKPILDAIERQLTFGKYMTQK